MKVGLIFTALTFSLPQQGKILDIKGKSKDKEKECKKGKKKGKRSEATGGAEDVDTSEADLLALLANQVVKEEKKKLNSKLRNKRGGKRAEKKISKQLLVIVYCHPHFHSHRSTLSH